MARWHGAALATLLLFLSTVGNRPLRADDAPIPSPDPVQLSLKKTLLVHTLDDRWITGKPLGDLADTLVLRHGDKSIRLARSAIDRAWTSRPAPLRRAIISGLSGLAGGAFVEIGLGSQCPDCAIDAGRVLEAAGISAALGTASGAIAGLFGGGWKQVVPLSESGSNTEPFPVWGATAGGGLSSQSVASHANGLLHVRLARWTFESPSRSVGVEFGTLSGGNAKYEYPGFTRDSLGFMVPNGDVGLATTRIRWAYATSQVRWRARSGFGRPQLTLGFGSYFSREAWTSVLRDSTGATLSVSKESSTDQTFGINIGGGATFGQKALRPGIDARLHWLPGRQQTWVTIGISADVR